jgi:hypothetical protein
MSVPDKIRDELRSLMWDVADRIGWMNLPQAAKSTQYENWINDPKIGGILSRYISRGHVRTYIKDSILKDYASARIADDTRVFEALRVPRTVTVVERYTKPHGRRLADGRVICWGRADDWKSVLMALHERAYHDDVWRPFAAVLTQAVGRFHEPHIRGMIGDAATKLGVKKIVWLEN